MLKTLRRSLTLYLVTPRSNTPQIQILIAEFSIFDLEIILGSCDKLVVAENLC